MRMKRKEKKEERRGNDLSRANVKQATLYCIRSVSTRQMTFPLSFHQFLSRSSSSSSPSIPRTTKRNGNNDAQTGLVIIFPSVLMDFAAKVRLDSRWPTCFRQISRTLFGQSFMELSISRITRKKIVCFRLIRLYVKIKKKKETSLFNSLIIFL